ncbi:MAG: carboxymuconolactone decarboxylase family protein [Bdellovibrionales bacterium]
MSQLKVLTKENAKPESAVLLNEVEKKYGFIPNLMGVLAESSVALKAYLELSNLVGQSSFSPEEQQAVLLAVSLENNCDYCVAAHSMVAAKMAGMPINRLDALRKEVALNDTRLDTLIDFTRHIVRSRGFIGEVAVEKFLATGFTKQQLLEVLVCVAMKTLSNYTNHIAETPVDQPFSEFKWSRDPAIPRPIGHSLG